MSSGPGAAVYIAWPRVTMLNTCHDLLSGVTTGLASRKLLSFTRVNIRGAMCEKTPFVVGADTGWVVVEGGAAGYCTRLLGNSRLNIKISRYLQMKSKW